MNELIVSLLTDALKTFFESESSKIKNNEINKKISDKMDLYIVENINNYLKNPYEKEQLLNFIMQNPKFFESKYQFINEKEKNEYIELFYKNNSQIYSVEDENIKKCLELYIEKVNDFLNKILSVDGKVLLDKICTSTNTIMDRLEGVEEIIKEKSVQKYSEFKKVYNIPQKNHIFWGREEIIKRLYSHLEKNNLIFITGLGGIGKSQIAKEFVYRLKDNYNLVLWLSASTEDELYNEYKNVSIYFKLISDNEPKELVKIKLSAFLENFEKVLIIIDGADDISMSYWLENIISNNALILVTTQKSNIDYDQFTVIPIENFNQQESIDFLLNCAKSRRICESDIEDVSKLAKLLQYYPLSLEYARSYVNELQISYKEYLEEYPLHKFDIYAESLPSYKKTAYAAWALSFRKVAEKNIYSKDILYICSFFAPNNIPFKDLFFEKEVYNYSKLHLKKIVEAISSYSLFVVNNGLVNMHSIIQEFIRNKIIQEKSFDLYFEKALTILSNSIPDEITSFSEQNLVHLVLEHATFLLSYKGKFDKEKVLKFIKKIVSKLYNFGRYLEVISFVKDQIKLSDFIEYVFDISIIVKLLIQSYHYTGNNPKAFEVLNKMKTFIEYSDQISEGEKFFLYVEYKNTEGIIQKDCGNIELSLKLYKESYYYLEKLGDLADRKQRVNVLLNVGNIYKRIGDYESALKNYNEALEIVDGNLNQVMRILGSIGHIYMLLNEYQLALEYFKSTLDLSLKIGDQRNKSIVLNHIGYCYYNMQLYDLATNFFNQSIAIAEKNDFILEQIHNLMGFAMIENKMGNYFQAKSYWIMVLNLSKEIDFQKGILTSREELNKIDFFVS